MDVIPCVVCGKPKTQVKIEYICDDPACYARMAEKHYCATLPPVARTRVKGGQSQAYRDKITPAWKDIAEATGFNYDGTPKT